MTNSRNKGLRFELQIASLLDDELGIKLHRDLEQSRTADHGDLISTDPSWLHLTLLGKFLFWFISLTGYQSE